MLKHFEIRPRRLAACLLASIISLVVLSVFAGTPADLVIKDGAVYTVNPAQPWASAVAVSGGVIQYVGTDAGVQSWIGPETHVVDLHGKMLLPGFQDAHVHPLYAGVEIQQCPLFDFHTADEYASAVKMCAAKHPDEKWIVGDGWLLSAFGKEGIPNKAILDAAVPDRPVALTSADGHSLWTNSMALKLAVVTKDTKDPPKGRIDRDPRTGEPVGSFQEDTAMSLVTDHIPPPSTKTLDDGLMYSVHYLNSLGITAWQDASINPDPDDPYQMLETYRRLDEAGKLTVHVEEALHWNDHKGIEQIPHLEDLRKKYTEGNIRTKTVKIFVDGIIEPRTAALLEDYSDKPGDRGPLLLQPDALKTAVVHLDAAGFQVHMHVIGDRAVRVALDAIEAARDANGPNDNRHHLAHLEVVEPEDIGRFVKLGVTANFQPLWAFADEYITKLTYPRLGPKRSRWIYPINSILKTGATVAFGSDWSVSSPNPLEGIEVAVTRMGPNGETKTPFIPEERIPLKDAIAAYTLHAAYVNHIDDRTGSIQVGKLADLTVVNRNLFKIKPTQISESKVVLTLFGGHPVYGTFDDAGMVTSGK